MKIKLTNALFKQRKGVVPCVMRAFLLLCCSTIFGFPSDHIFSQNVDLRIEKDQEITVYEVFDLIQKQTKYNFIYQADIFKDSPKVQLKKGTIKADKLLRKSLPSKEYKIIKTDNNYVVITRILPQQVQQAQRDSIKVHGVVKDVDGQPLLGVTVRVLHTQNGVSTDLEGSYTIYVAGSESILQFTSIGFKTKEVVVANQTMLNITLEEATTELAEVTLNAGYYKVKDRERTGSISKVSREVIEAQPVNNPLEALQGRLAGVYITQSTGTPGGGFKLRVRGQNSIAAGNEPLYVIDGVPFDSGSMSYNGTSGTIMPNAQISPLNAISPSSIAAVEVLKDADATAIYGARGANGVILITTKNNKVGKTTFSVKAQTGIANISRRMDLMNTKQYLEMRKQAFENDGFDTYPSNAYDLNGTWISTRETDWQDVLIGGTAHIQNYEGNIAGGNDRTSFRISGTYGKESTVFPKDFNYSRGNVMASLNHVSLDDRFAVNFTASYAAEKNNQPGGDLSKKARTLSPNAPALYDEEGNLNWENSTWQNPLAPLGSEYLNGIVSFLSNINVSYQLLTNLKISSSIGYTEMRIDEEKTNPHTIYNPAYGLTSDDSNIFTNNGKRHSWIIEPQIDYHFTHGKGKFTTIFGGTFQEQNSEQLSLLAIGFSNNTLMHNLSAASNVLIMDEKKNEYHYQAFFGRINYNWDNKYILNLTGRRDGSSRFGSGKRYANFGAIGGAWVFSKENGVKRTIPVLSFGKLRASYGITGNDQIGDYQYFDTYSLTSRTYDGIVGLEPTRLYNPLFAWEKNEKLNLALDLGLWNDQLKLSSTYFSNTSSNQLVGLPLPGTTGFQKIQANLDATVRNEGWEFELSSENIQQRNITWRSDFNLTIPKNRLVAYDGLENSPYANKYVIGKPLTIFKLYHLTGVNPNTGLFEFEDFNNDGQISSSEDRQLSKDLAPEFYGGFTNTITYKNVKLVLFLQFTKQKALNNFFNYAPAGYMLNQPITSLNGWQQSGDVSSYQRYTTGANYEAVDAYYRFMISDAAISDASYIKLKNVAISYQLPEKWLGNTDCLLTLQGQNLLTLTSFNGGDPEQVIGYLPQLRRINVGVQLNF